MSGIVASGQSPASTLRLATSDKSLKQREAELRRPELATSLAALLNILGDPGPALCHAFSLVLFPPLQTLI